MTSTITERVFARARPNAIALCSDEDQLTYGELELAAATMAARLSEEGVGSGSIVAIDAERRPATVALMLATMALGAAAMPVEPGATDERSERVRRGATFCVSRVSLHPLRADTPEALLGSGRVGRLRSRSDARSVAYILHTSGSTGAAKGVMVEHRSLLNLIDGIDHLFGTDARRSRTVQATALCPLTFDVAMWEIFGALVAGGTVHLLSEACSRDVQCVGEIISARRVTRAYLPPYYLADLARSFAASDVVLREVLVGVEPIAWGTIAALAAAVDGVAIVNGYGPTETTVCATGFRVPVPTPVDDRRVPIGRALPGNEVLLVDDDGRRVLDGVGEIVVRGVGLAQGYLGDERATTERFVDLEIDGVRGGRAYRTGDLARIDEQGDLVFLGRVDGQVKVDGRRVELTDVEHAALRHPQVDEARAVVDVGRGSQLILVVRAEAPLTETEVQAFLSTLLPTSIRPTRVVVLDRLPVTANGKLDTGAIGQVLRRRPTGLPVPVPIENDDAATVAEIWSAVLDVDAVGAEDDFFVLGGTSRQAIEVCAELGRRWGTDVSPSWLYETAVLTAFARRAREGDDPVPGGLSARVDRRLALGRGRAR